MLQATGYPAEIADRFTQLSQQDTEGFFLVAKIVRLVMPVLMIICGFVQ